MTTRAQAETILIKRVGDLLTQAGLDGTTHDGTNTDLADPIGYALRSLGHTTADPSSPTTAEVAAVAAADTDEFLSLAELRALETILSCVLDLVDTTVGPRREAYNQMADGLQAKIARLTQQLQQQYGSTLGDLEIGVIQLQIAQHSEDE